MPLPDARLNTKGEVFRRLKDVGTIFPVPSGAETTLTAAVTEDNATISVDDETGFSDGDFISISTGEAQEIRRVNGAPAAGELTLDLGAGKDHISGAAVVQYEKRNIGYVAESGATVDIAPEFFELNAANFVGTLIRRITSIPIDFGLPLLNVSMANLALSAGQDEEEMVDGSGTASEPFRVRWYPDLMAQLGDVGVYMAALREDLEEMELRFFGIEFDISKSMSLAQGGATELGFAGRATGGMEWLKWSAA